MMFSNISGDARKHGLSQDDKESVESFRELAKVHKRQKNFLELRLRDPESLYEVDEVRAKLKPKKQALNDKHLVNKGMMKANLAKGPVVDENVKKPDQVMSKQKSDSSDLAKMPDDNSDDQVYQFVQQRYLVLSKLELIDIIKELQA
jgi:hypothetical protein